MRGISQINQQKIKNVTQWDVGQHSTTTHVWVMEVFLEPVFLVFGKKESINIPFWKFFHQKTSFYNLQKVLKNTVPNTTVPNTTATDLS